MVPREAAKRLAYCLLLMVLMCVMPVAASAGDNLLHFWQLALKNDPQLRGAEFESLANQEALQQSYAGLLPKVSADASLTRTYQRINSSDNQVYTAGSTDYNTRAYSLNLVQPLFRYGAYVAVNQAKSVQSRTELEVEKARQDLALRVAEAYMEVLLNRDRLAAVKAEESALEQHHVRARERVDKGMAPITDRYDTEARLAAVSAQRVEAENALQDAFQALTDICGVAVTDITSLKTDIPLQLPQPANIQQWTDIGMKQNLDILIQKLKADVSDKEMQRQKAAHLPSLDFQADYTNNNTKGSLFGGGSDTSTYDLMLKLNIPIYEGGIVSSRTREASNLHQSALQGLTRQVRATERRVRSTYNGIISAISRVQAMKKSIDAQLLVVEAKEEGFKAGLFISLAVLDATQDLYRYKKEYSQARNDYILNFLRLKHAVGALKADELSQVNAWLQD